MSQHQTLAVGQTKPAALVAKAAAHVSADVAMLGFTGIRMLPALSQLRIIIVGGVGSGKSNLIQSCDYGLVLNADVSPTTTDDPRARMIPGRRSDGAAVEPDPSAPLLPSGNPDPEKGIQVEMSWDYILSKKSILVDLAKREEPSRPRMIFLDTVDMSLDLVQRWLATKFNAPSFSEIGMNDNKWGNLYDAFDEFATDLRRVGYGTCLVCHIGTKQISLGINEKRVMENVTLLPGNMWNTINNFADLVGVVEKEVKEEPLMIQKKGPDGKPMFKTDGTSPIMIPSGQTRKTVKVYLCFDESKYPGIAKRRGNLPERILLPKTGAWDAFEAAWKKGNSAPSRPEPAPSTTEEPAAT